MTIDYEKVFKVLADRLPREPIIERALEQRVPRHLWAIDGDTGKLARANRGRAIERVLASAGTAAPATPPATARGSKWVAFNAIADHLDFGRRYSTRTNQVHRSFENTSLKQRALELVSEAVTLWGESQT